MCPEGLLSATGEPEVSDTPVTRLPSFLPLIGVLVRSSITKWSYQLIYQMKWNYSCFVECRFKYLYFLQELSSWPVLKSYSISMEKEKHVLSLISDFEHNH